jgi:hypothetical protein
LTATEAAGTADKHYLLGKPFLALTATEAAGTADKHYL